MSSSLLTSDQERHSWDLAFQKMEYDGVDNLMGYREVFFFIPSYEEWLIAERMGATLFYKLQLWSPTDQPSLMPPSRSVIPYMAFFSLEECMAYKLSINYEQV